MHQYAHYPVDGNTFRERLRNVSFTRRRWQDCPAMPCPGCGCRIIPSIPATILQDVCLMLGFPFSAELSAPPDTRTRFPSLGRALRFTVVAHPVYAADAFCDLHPMEAAGRITERRSIS